MKPKSKISLIHQWLRKKHGKANKCINPSCPKKSKNFDYCLITGKEHKKDRKHYRTMCRSCHYKYDYKNGKHEPQKEATRRMGRKNGRINGMVQCKFKPADIYKIRSRYGFGEFQKDIAKTYRVDRSTISLIVNYKTYRY